MRKPKSLKGPASKKERHRYRSWKGSAFPRRKINRFPSLMEMYRKIKSLEKNDRINARARTNYFFKVLFSPRIKGYLTIIGCEIPPIMSLLDKPQGRRYSARLVSNQKRIRNCSERELQKIEKAVRAIGREFEIADMHIRKECTRFNALSTFPDESTFVRHEFQNMGYGLSQQLTPIRRIIMERKNRQNLNL